MANLLFWLVAALAVRAWVAQAKPEPAPHGPVRTPTPAVAQDGARARIRMRLVLGDLGAVSRDLSATLEDAREGRISQGELEAALDGSFEALRQSREELSAGPWPARERVAVFEARQACQWLSLCVLCLGQASREDLQAVCYQVAASDLSQGRRVLDSAWIRSQAR